MWRVNIPWPWKDHALQLELPQHSTYYTTTTTTTIIIIIIVIPTHKKLHHKLLWFCAHPRTVVYDLPLPEVPQSFFIASSI